MTTRSHPAPLPSPYGTFLLAYSALAAGLFSILSFCLGLFQFLLPEILCPGPLPRRLHLIRRVLARRPFSPWGLPRATYLGPQLSLSVPCCSRHSSFRDPAVQISRNSSLSERFRSGEAVIDWPVSPSENKNHMNRLLPVSFHGVVPGVEETMMHWGLNECMSKWIWLI